MDPEKKHAPLAPASPRAPARGPDGPTDAARRQLEELSRRLASQAPPASKPPRP